MNEKGAKACGHDVDVWFTSPDDEEDWIGTSAAHQNQNGERASSQMSDRQRRRASAPPQRQQETWAAERLQASQGLYGLDLSAQPLFSRPLPPTSATVFVVTQADRPFVNSSSAEVVPSRLASTSAPPQSARPLNRICKTPVCGNYIVHKGLCYRHGGGRKCSVEACNKSAKHQGLCYRHGGSVECKVADCTSRAKTRGLCWTHGGGSQCTQDDCVKVAVSNGRCWAHGGGNRCIHDDCQRPGIKRIHGFCKKHYEELKNVDYYEV